VTISWHRLLIYLKKSVHFVNLATSFAAAGLCRNLNSAMLIKDCSLSQPTQLTPQQSNPLPCKSSLRPSPERPLLLRSNLLTPSTTSRQRFKTRKGEQFQSRPSLVDSHSLVYLLTSSDLSSPANSLRTVVPCPTTIFRKSQPFILSSACVVACRFS
jgi:hypothetical protein